MYITLILLPFSIVIIHFFRSEIVIFFMVIFSSKVVKIVRIFFAIPITQKSIYSLKV
jgi:hypothetical protein